MTSATLHTISTLQASIKGVKMAPLNGLHRGALPDCESIKMVIGMCVKKNMNMSRSNGRDSKDFVAMRRSDLQNVKFSAGGRRIAKR